MTLAREQHQDKRRPKLKQRKELHQPQGVADQDLSDSATLTVFVHDAALQDQFSGSSGVQCFARYAVERIAGAGDDPTIQQVVTQRRHRPAFTLQFMVFIQPQRKRLRPKLHGDQRCGHGVEHKTEQPPPVARDGVFRRQLLLTSANIRTNEYHRRCDSQQLPWTHRRAGWTLEIQQLLLTPNNNQMQGVTSQTRI